MYAGTDLLNPRLLARRHESDGASVARFVVMKPNAPRNRPMKFSNMAATALLLFPVLAAAQGQPSIGSATATTAQQTVPPAVQQSEADVERTVKRFRMGIQGGVGLDPEIVDVGVHATFSPLFTPSIAFRPGIELGVG